MFREYLDLENALANISLTAKTYVELGEKNADAGNNALYSLYNMLAERVTTTPESKAMYVRAATLLNMLRYLIEGRAMEEDWLHVMMEEEFGVVTAERQAQKDDLAGAEAKAEREASRQERWEHLRAEDRILADDPQVLDVCDAIILDERMQKNAEADYQRMGFLPHDRRRVDMRMIRIFTRGYEVNEDGEPLTEQDRANREADMNFVQDYMSGDMERRRSHLDRITQEMLSLDVGEETLEEEYIREHPYEIHRAQQRMVYFENMVRENPDYYNSLPRATRARLRHRFSIFAPFLNTQSSAIGARGIEYNRGRLYRKGEEAPVEWARIGLPEFREAYDAALPEYRYAEARIRGFAKATERQPAPQARTREEFEWLSSLYPEARKAKFKFRDQLLQTMREKKELTDGAVRSLKSNRGLFERMSFFLDERLPEEANFQRVKAHLTFSSEARQHPDGQVPFPRAEVLDQIRDVCREEIESLRNYQEWIDLTEDGIYGNAEEILRVQMSIEHVERLAKNTFNPSTGKSLWEELIDPELLAIFFAINSYKSAIRATALNVKAFMGGSSFSRVGQAWLIGDETDTESAFADQEDQYIQMRRMLDAMSGYQALKARQNGGEPTETFVDRLSRRRPLAEDQPRV
jgi:acyl carrier protein phosphodiesterase